MDKEALRALADQCICHPVSRSITEVEEAGSAIIELLDRVKALEGIEQERTALLVNEQNLREELEALKAAMGEPVAWINKDHTYVELSTPSTVYGSHTIPLYALTNKDQA